MDTPQQELVLAGDDSPVVLTEQSVKVAVNIRPLIASEVASACQECLAAVPGEPQVQVIPLRAAFTFDHVYGGGGIPMSRLFDECVQPLVDGLFQGYNATVLAYGQTGSGKSYTMGTGYSVNGGLDQGVTPQVMNSLFERVERLKPRARFHIRVCLIEVHNDEIRDLLDLSMETIGSGGASPACFPSTPKKPPPIQLSEKQPITIRELAGGVALVGATEVEVHSLQDMVECLENGLLFRATGSHLMNARSSRSHAIFTITVEQQRWRSELEAGVEEPGEYLSAKMHLVDLAGSERIKRTKAEGLRMKEGIHINRGLLALGNVISSLGDEKKRREGGHVPYRDSKLTRLLQDSLGGNSRTVMIACVSPADTNLEETMNTLKYANRARNIENKATVNRLGEQPSIELQRLRQQLLMLQAEVAAAKGSVPSVSKSGDDMQTLKQKMSFLESTNAKFRQALVEAREAQATSAKQVSELEARNVKLAAELALALETARSEAQSELESNAQTIAQLQAQLQAARAEAKAEMERMKAADSEFRSKFVALRDNAREEAEGLWRSEAQLRAEIGAVQERVHTEAKRVLVAETAEKQLRAQLNVSREQLEAEERKVQAAESAGRALQTELLALQGKVEAETKDLQEKNELLKTALAAAQEGGRAEKERAEKALAENKHLAARAEAAEARAEMETQRAMDAQAAALAAQSTIVQLTSQIMGSRESVGVEVAATNRQMQTNLVAAQELVQVEATKALEAQTSVAQLRAEVAAAQEMVRREEERREEVQAAMVREQQRVVESQEKAAEAMARARELEGSVVALQETMRRVDGELKQARERIGEEETRRREADGQVMQLKTELAVAQEISKGAAQNYQEAYANFLAEGKKVFDLQTKMGELSSELAANKERLFAAVQAAEVANASLVEAQSGTIAAQGKYQVMVEKCVQAEAAATHLRTELGLARETAKQEAMKAAKAQSELLELTRELGVAEERAREAGLRASQTAVERDAFREAAFSGHLTDDHVRQIISHVRTRGASSITSFRDDISSRSSFVGSSLDEDEFAQLEGKSAQRWSAATCIQTWWRMWRMRREFARQKEAAILIQVRWRSYLVKRKKLKGVRGAVGKSNLSASETSANAESKLGKPSPIVSWGFLALDSPGKSGQRFGLWKEAVEEKTLAMKEQFMEESGSERPAAESNGFVEGHLEGSEYGAGLEARDEFGNFDDEDDDMDNVPDSGLLSVDYDYEEDEDDTLDSEGHKSDGVDVRDHRSPSSVLESRSSYSHVSLSDSANSSSFADEIGEQSVSPRESSLLQSRSTPAMAPVSEDEELEDSRDRPPKLKGSRSVGGVFRLRVKQNRPTVVVPTQEGYSDPLLAGQRRFTSSNRNPAKSPQRPFLSYKKSSSKQAAPPAPSPAAAPSDPPPDNSTSTSPHRFRQVSPSRRHMRSVSYEKGRFWGESRTATLGLSLGSPIGHEASRVWGSSALGLHGSNQRAPATPAASPVRKRREGDGEVEGAEEENSPSARTDVNAVVE